MLNSILLSNKDLINELEKIKKSVSSQDKKIELVFNYLKKFTQEKENSINKIGFKQKSN